jgi:hypothetical protein
MFSQHQPLIAEHASTPEGLVDIALLAIVSARMPFARVREDFAAVKNGDTTPLFAWKFEAYRRFKERAEKVKARLEREYGFTRRSPYLRTAYMLAEISGEYGLGFVKGGFVLQMAYGVSGCVDTRNIDTFGVSRNAVAPPSVALKYETRLRKARAYTKLINSLGGTGFLWDAWCTYYADSGDNPDWSDGWDVSAEHCRILGIDPGERPQIEEIPF